MLGVSEGLGGREEGETGVGGGEAGVDCAKTFGPLNDGGEMQRGGRAVKAVEVTGRLEEDGWWGRRRRGGHGVRVERGRSEFVVGLRGEGAEAEGQLNMSRDKGA